MWHLRNISTKLFLESCFAEKRVDAYGGLDWPDTAVNESSKLECPYNPDGAEVNAKNTVKVVISEIKNQRLQFV